MSWSLAVNLYLPQVFLALAALSSISLHEMAVGAGLATQTNDY
ncbi:hypothetical protein SAMN04488603_1163 [Paenibacillus sp. cl130]|nr:hypothetical protein SAMN04488603_1163 [Paenibacillus sp. cl130]